MTALLQPSLVLALIGEIGGVIYPIAFRQLLRQLSFGWSVRVLVFTILATSVFLLAIISVRMPSSVKRKIRFDYKPLIQELANGLWTIALVFCFAAQYTPAFFI